MKYLITTLIILFLYSACNAGDGSIRDIIKKSCEGAVVYYVLHDIMEISPVDTVILSIALFAAKEYICDMIPSNSDIVNRMIIQLPLLYFDL